MARQGEPRGALGICVGLSTLTLVPSQASGTSSYLRGLLSELSRCESVDMTVLANSLMASRISAWSGHTIPARVISSFAIRDTPRSRHLAIARALMTPGRLQRELPQDLDLLHYPLTLPLPRVDTPTVVTLHDVQHHDFPGFFSRTQRQWRKAAYDDPAKRARLVITVSEYSKSRIVEHLGIAPEHVEVIYHGVDRARFTPAKSETVSGVLAALRLPERFLLYPAALWTHKNHGRLLDAIARLDDNELGLVLTGPTFNEIANLRARAEGLGLGGRVRHLGLVDDELISALYQRATALVFPSLHEGFGLPVLEAMASGCPVVASTSGALPEICGDAAMQFDPLDIDSIAGAIAQVINDDRLRGQLAAAGRDWAKHFTWRGAAERHADVYARAYELGASVP